MLADSCLQFLGYKITKISFNLSDAFNKTNEFRISPNFSILTQESDNNEYQVILSIKVEGTESEPQPFNLYVDMVGRFSFQTDTDETTKQTIIRENTTAIMFPFFRAAIASITSAANIPALILPVINISETLKENMSHN